MVALTKLYTKTGDKGDTGLVGGERIGKESIRVDSFGIVDELNAFLGLLRTEVRTRQKVPCLFFWKRKERALAKALQETEIAALLPDIQNELFDIGSELASPPDSEITFFLSSSHIERLEASIDTAVSLVPPLRSFVLPGGSLLGSYCHIARTVCRRAERKIVELHREEPVREEILIYINRLSDLLFAWSRVLTRAQHGDAGEFLWTPGEK